MFNHVALLGRLAEKPEIRQTQNGDTVTRFDLAVQVASQKKDTPPDYIPVTCWNKQAEFVERYLDKGKQIVVEGRIRTQKYTDKDGNTRKDVFVKADRLYFAEGRTDEAPSNAFTAPANVAGAPAGGFEDIGGDEDLPF